MRAYKSHDDVKNIITEKLNGLGTKARVDFHSLKQAPNTVVQMTVFKAVVALEGIEPILSGISDIGTDTDRAISFIEAGVAASDEGEVCYLFFEAKINPFDEEY